MKQEKRLGEADFLPTFAAAVAQDLYIGIKLPKVPQAKLQASASQALAELCSQARNSAYQPYFDAAKCVLLDNGVAAGACPLRR